MRALGDCRRAAGTVALGAGLTLAASAFGSPSFYVPGVALIALGTLAVIWVALAARGATVVRVPGPPTVEEEAPYPVHVGVRGGRVPPPGGEVLDPLLGWPVPLSWRWPRRVRMNVRFERRGRRRLAPPRLVVCDPLGLAATEREGDESGDLLVLPRVEPVLSAPAAGVAGTARAAGGAGESGSPRGASTASAAEQEFDTLRPAQPGSPASRIHWPAVARTGELLERRLVAESLPGPLVVLDPRTVSVEALDSAARAAASLCVRLARDGGCALLLPGDRRPTGIGSDLSTWPALHARLALVEATDPPPSAPSVGRAGSLFWVTGDRTTLPAGAQRSAAGTRYLVTAASFEALVPRFSVAGCNGYELGARAGTRRVRSAPPATHAGR